MNIIIIGAGPSGMMCAIKAKNENNNVTIIEKNDKAGKKLLLTGSGRCNYANEITRDRLFPPKIVAQPEMFLASNDIKRQKEIIDGCVYLGYEAFTVDVHLEYDKTNGFHTQEDLSTLCDTFTYAKNLGYPTTALKIH